MAEHGPRSIDRLEIAVARLEDVLARRGPAVVPDGGSSARLEAAAREALARLDRLLGR